mmetsp:Transcript_5913/g.10990  ORF Transcript_5913/g.10990 Transcript_5913/m.10990 type:complete len:507 (+) Transcript_5913:127-1647(+)
MNFISDFLKSSPQDQQDVPGSIESIEKGTAKDKERIARPPTLRDIPKLTKEIVQTDSDKKEEAVAAAKKLYELCDVGHKANREPMVASGKYDVLHPLTLCLLHEGNDEKLHFVCLTLNNLAIPHDNKRVMILERGAKKLIGNLCKVIQSGKKEAYLCCIILMNLSFLEPAGPIIGQFSPKTTLRGPRLTPLENPNSLLRILQELTAHAARGTADFRWAFGLLANLSRHSDNALLIGLTGIPRMAIENVSLSKIDASEWKTNSLEDFSLYLLLHLAEATKDGLQGALEVVEPIMRNDSGIQGLKATMICAFLELPWEKFPNYGVIAAGAVSELMGNTFERTGKKRVYNDNDFQLRTAVSAYAALASAAFKADSENNSVVHTKVMALPTSVALLFQIINAIALHWGDDDGDQTFETYHWDIKAGDLAVGAVMSLLPALLEAEDPPRQSMGTQQACAELSKVFVFFSKKTSSIAVKARAAEVAEKLTESASGSALPLLEASYDLWHHGT